MQNLQQNPLQSNQSGYKSLCEQNISKNSNLINQPSYENKHKDQNGHEINSRPSRKVTLWKEHEFKKLIEFVLFKRKIFSTGNEAQKNGLLRQMAMHINNQSRTPDICGSKLRALKRKHKTIKAMVNQMAKKYHWSVLEIANQVRKLKNNKKEVIEIKENFELKSLNWIDPQGQLIPIGQNLEDNLIWANKNRTKNLILIDKSQHFEENPQKSSSKTNQVLTNQIFSSLQNPINLQQFLLGTKLNNQSISQKSNQIKHCKNSIYILQTIVPINLYIPVSPLPEKQNHKQSQIQQQLPFQASKNENPQKFARQEDQSKQQWSDQIKQKGILKIKKKIVPWNYLQTLRFTYFLQVYSQKINSSYVKLNKGVNQESQVIKKETNHESIEKDNENVQINEKKIEKNPQNSQIKLQSIQNFKQIRSSPLKASKNYIQASIFSKMSKFISTNKNSDVCSQKFLDEIQKHGSIENIVSFFKKAYKISQQQQKNMIIQVYLFLNDVEKHPSTIGTVRSNKNQTYIIKKILNNRNRLIKINPNFNCNDQNQINEMNPGNNSFLNIRIKSIEKNEK